MLKPILNSKIKIKQAIVKGIGKLWLKTHVKKGTLLLICSWGIGDSLYVRFFLDKIKKTYGCEKIEVLCKSHTGEVFKDGNLVQRIYSNTRIAKWVGYYCRKEKDVYSEKYIYCHFINPKDAFVHKRKSIVESYFFDILRLDGEISISYPEIDYCSCPEIVKKYSIDKQTIILSPYAASAINIDNFIWEKLVGIFCNKGYKVLTNCNGVTEKAIKGSKAFTESIRALAVCAHYCGFVVCFRSGISDWLACTDCNLMVVNNVNKLTHEIWKDDWNVNYFSKKFVPNINCHSDREEEIIDEILYAMGRYRNG